MLFAFTILFEPIFTRVDSLSTCITEQLSPPCRNHYSPLCDFLYYRQVFVLRQLDFGFSILDFRLGILETGFLWVSGSCDAYSGKNPVSDDQCVSPIA